MTAPGIPGDADAHASGTTPTGATPTAVIFAGGDPPEHEVLRGLPEVAYVIAADSGLVHAQQAGFAVDVVIGDLDSAPADALDDARIEGVEIAEFPEDKDQTDLELAFERALEVGVDSLVVLCADGGRPDHFLANVGLLARDRYSSMRITAFFGRCRVAVVRDTVTLHGQIGDLLTLLAVGGPASDITTTGLHWPLTAATVAPGETRGVSNTFDTGSATVTIGRGVLFAIQPEGTR